MELLTQVQILDETVSLLFHPNALGKGMNPFSYGLIVGQTVSLVLVKHSCLGEGKLNLNQQYSA